MPVKMKPTSEIKVKLGIQKNGPVEKFLVHTCKIHMDKYVPYDKGTLADNAVEEPGQVRYIQPYARYQYKGMREDGSRVIVNRTKTKHPLATSYWDKHMVTAEMPDIIKETQDFINRGGK